MEELLQRTKAISWRIEECEGVLKSVIFNKHEKSTVYLGSGYFAELTHEQTKSFLNRKIATLQDELTSLNRLRGMNEEGLPILDIVEELDDDDNVINSRVEQAGSYFAGLARNSSIAAAKSNNQIKGLAKDKSQEVKPVNSANAAQPGEPGQRASSVQKTRPAQKPNKTTGVGETTKTRSNTEASSNPAKAGPSANDRIQEITEKTPAESNEPNGRNSDDVRMFNYSPIEPADMLELELMDYDENDEIDLEDEDNSTDRIDYDFDNQDLDEMEHSDEDDDDDDDDDDDEDENDENGPGKYAFGWKGGALFPQNEQTKKILERQLGIESSDPAKPKSALAVPKNSPMDTTESPVKTAETSPKKAAGGVRFAESIDVHEFESDKTDRNARLSTFEPEVMKKQSHFKLQRAHAAAAAAKAAAPTTHHSAGHTAALAAAAKASSNMAKSKSNSAERPVNSYIIEKSPVTPSTPEKSPIKSTNDKSSPEKHSPEKQTTAKASPSRIDGAGRTKPGSPSPLKQGDETLSKSVFSRRYGDSAMKKPDAKPLAQYHTHAPKPDPKYVDIGNIRDEDMPEENVDRSKLIKEQADAIYENSFIPDDEFLKLHSTPDDKVASESTNAVDTVDKDKPIMESSILERTSLPGTDDNAHSQEMQNDMHEIKARYQKLRQKLIYEGGGYKKSDAESEIEALEPAEGKRKVSRFKAASALK